MTKERKLAVLKTIHKYLLLTTGCFILAFGDAAFISPLGLVTGGVLSVGVIAQHFVYQAGSTFYIVDIVTWAMQAILLGVSFFFMGKRFTMRSLYSTILYPALFTLLTRIPAINGLSIGDHIASFFRADPTDWGLLTLAALAGGTLVGLGVGICYHGGGSTGGLDVISAILAKTTPVKEALSAFVLDALLVIIGIICMRNIVSGLIGVLGAFACALAVQYSYVNAASFVIADIISSQTEAIQKYVHETMDRATTVIDVTGGYSGEDKKILRVAFSKRELIAFRAFIASVDPRAFVTFTQASMINGEGFDPLVTLPKQLHKRNRKNETNNEELHG